MDCSVRKLVIVCSACTMDSFKLYGNYDEDDLLNKRMMLGPFLLQLAVVMTRNGWKAIIDDVCT